MKESYKISDDLYIATSVATKILDVTDLTLRRWVAAKRMPAPIRISGRNYYSRRLIDEYLARLVNETCT
jgi:hypothetical protein